MKKFKKLLNLVKEEEHDDVDLVGNFEEFDPLPIKGEYWFDEHGGIMYADGDMGGMNHETYASQRAAEEILLLLGIDGCVELGDETHLTYLVDHIADCLDITDEEEREEFLYDPFEHIPDKILENYPRKNKDDLIELTKVAFGNGDPREYAIKHWKWSRVHGNHIEVNRLTEKQMKLVYDGIIEALEQEGIYEEDEITRADETIYYISTYTGKRFTIKLKDMNSSENISKLEQEPLRSQKNSYINDYDKQAMHDYYKNRPLGDSFEWEFDSFVDTVLEHCGEDEYCKEIDRFKKMSSKQAIQIMLSLLKLDNTSLDNLEDVLDYVRLTTFPQIDAKEFKKNPYAYISKKIVSDHDDINPDYILRLIVKVMGRDVK